MSETSNYRVNIGIRWVDETTPPAKKAKRGLDDVAKAAKAMFGAAIVRQGVKFAAELVKIGATAERQANALNNLAAAAGTSGDAIVKAIQGASDFTIDRMGAMAAANRALVMDVAKSPAEFERLTKVAVALGRAMGVDAATSIDDFVTASGRQSKLIADNLGLVVNAEDAYLRYAEANNTTVDAMDDAAKKQAFLTEMLRQGEVKMRDLGDQTLDSAGEIEQASAAWKDLKTSAGTTLATIASSTGILQKLSENLRSVSETVDELDEMEITFKDLDDAMLQSWKTGESGAEVLRGLRENYNLTQADIERYAHTVATASEVERYGFTQTAEAAVEEAAAIKMTADERNDMLFAMHQVNRAQEELASTTPPVTSALVEESEAAKKAKDELLKLNEAAVMAALQIPRSLSGRGTGGLAKTMEEFHTTSEREAARHQEKLANIRKRGASRSVQVDAAAEQEKIQVLQNRLAVSLQQQAEFTDKTRESTRMAKENQVATIRGQIAEQTQLLDDYHAGRLVQAGENVTGLLAEENRLHEEKMKIIRAEREEKKEARRQEIGEQVATTAIGELGRALSEERISLNDYKIAVDEVQLSFGLTDQASINLSNSILSLVGQIAEGTLPVSDFNEALETQTRIYDTELQQLEKFGELLSTNNPIVVDGYGAQGIFNEELGKSAERLQVAKDRVEKNRDALDNLNSTTFQAGLELDALVAKMNEIPEEKTITINIRTKNMPTSLPSGVGRALGGPVRAGEIYMVGEGGPELFVPGSSGQIVSNSRAFDSHDTFNFNTPHGYAAVQESQRRQRRQRMGRVM